MEPLGYDDFMNFGMKLGGEWCELDEMWWGADKNDDGTLDLGEQDNIWWSLMEKNDDYDNDVVDHLWDIEEAAWDILDSVWEAQNDIWEDEWDCDCWDDEWDCDCWDSTWEEW